MSRRTALITLLLVAGCAAAPVATTQGSYDREREENQVQPVTIEADEKIDRIDKDRRVIFIGNVITRQRHWLLYADRIEVYLYETGDRILRATSMGNVRITTSDCQKGAARRAEYYDLDQRVVLRGNARLWSPENFVSGQNIVVHLPRSGSAADCASAQNAESSL